MKKAGINFQTLPKELRKLFIADANYQFMQFDMSQIEARIVSCYLPDPKLYQFFESGKDVHSLVASEIFNVDVDSLTKASPERAKAKACVHGANYGLNAPRFAVMTGLKLHEAKRVLSQYLDMFSIQEWWIKTVEELRINKRILTTVYGRRGHFYGTWTESKTSFDWLSQSTVLARAYAFKPQSINADFTKERLVYIMKRVDLSKFIPLINLHDEWICLVHDSIIPEVTAIIKEEVGKPIVINKRVLTVPCSIKITSKWE